MNRYAIMLFFVFAKTAYPEATYYFSGTLSQDIGGFILGTPFAGTFTYDQNPGSTQSYSIFNININNQDLQASNVLQVFSVNGGLLTVSKHPNLGSGGSDGWAQTNSRYLGFGISLVDDANQDLFDNQSPPADLSLDRLASANMWVAEYDKIAAQTYGGPALYTYSKTTEVQSSITSLVPEPSALSLLAIGLSGLAMIRRRRS